MSIPVSASVIFNYLTTVSELIWEYVYSDGVCRRFRFPAARERELNIRSVNSYVRLILGE